MEKKRINSRTKGSTNERDIAKILSNWAGYEFNRVPASGGLRWKTDNNVTGDLVAPAEIPFPFNIECKKVECDWDFDKLLTGKSELWKFWEQANNDAERLYKEGITDKPKEPLLIFTKNRREKYVMFRYYVFNRLNFNPPINVITAYIALEKDVAIMPLEYFLANVTLDEVNERLG